MTAPNIGRRIKDRREALGMKQEELARKADVALSVLARIEQGKTTDPRSLTLYAIARALGVTVDSLIEEQS